MRYELEMFVNFARGYYCVITSLSLAKTNIMLRCDVNKTTMFQNKVYD